MKRGAAAAAAAAAGGEAAPLKPSKLVRTSALGRAYIVLDRPPEPTGRGAAEKKWDQVPTSQQNAIINDTVRYIVLAATAGTGPVVESKLKSTVLGVHRNVEVTGGFLIEKARGALRDTFGWELSQARKTLTEDDASDETYQIVTKPEHFVRLCSSDGVSAAGGSAVASLAAASAASGADPLFLRRRGLVIAATSLILLSPEKRLAETRLFELLESTGLREAGGGADEDGDEDHGAVIPGWRRLIREDFVRDEFLERKMVAEGGRVGDDGGEAAGAKVAVYSIGPRTRSVIGVPHLLEFACTTTGRMVPAALGNLRMALGPEGADIDGILAAVKQGHGAAVPEGDDRE